MLDVLDNIWSLLSMVLTPVAFLLLGRKLKWKRRWLVLIPGVGYYKIGQTVNLELHGLFCMIISLLGTIQRFLPIDRLPDQWQVGLALFALVLELLFFVLRLFLGGRLLSYFRMKRVWILLWILFPAVTMLIMALDKNLQPSAPEAISEDWKAGTTPADIPASESAGGFVPSSTGLSIDLRERSVRDLSKKRYLLKDIRLNIPNGSLVLLLGGSGSGKTTFVNAVIGYEKANATILLNGSDVYKDYKRMKYRIGFVPQQNLIRMSDTVRHTVGDAALLRVSRSVSAEERRKKTQEAMDLMGLTAGGGGLVGKKSGGMLRRISIAMELVSDPELFVLDEPDSGLDGVIARELFTQLRQIADQGKIVIVITHTPDRVVDLFDRVIVLARDSGRCGRLAFYGTPQEARDFFGKDSMEGVVMSVNSKDAGGDGLADEYIERFAERTSGEKEAAAK